MASPAASMSRWVCQSRSNAVAVISRSFEVSSTLFQRRGYSDDGLKDPLPSTPLDASEQSAGHVEDPVSPLDSRGISPISDGVSPANTKPVVKTFGTYGTENKSTYPPRNHRTPRGVYKAIVLGEVGQPPIQKILKSGKSVTLFSVGTGGMYNNRRPFEGEGAEEFAQRSYTQWHRVAVYQDRVAGLVMQNVKAGSQVYLEGNIESRVYNDPNSGIVKRIREIAIRANGRLMFMETPIAIPSATSAQEPLFATSPADFPVSDPCGDS